MHLLGYFGKINSLSEETDYVTLRDLTLFLINSNLHQIEKILILIKFLPPKNSRGITGICCNSSLTKKEKSPTQKIRTKSKWSQNRKYYHGHGWRQHGKQ